MNESLKTLAKKYKDAPDIATKLPVADAIVEIILNPPRISRLEDKKRNIVGGNTPLNHY